MNRRVCLYLGLIIGVVVDGILRLTSGDEGNLLVHAAVFLGSAVVAMLIIYGFLQLRKDEATSALDNISQNVVTDTLSRMKGTRIVIAHRLSTIKGCEDRLRPP